MQQQEENQMNLCPSSNVGFFKNVGIHLKVFQNNFMLNYVVSQISYAAYINIGFCITKYLLPYRIL
jgi:hypothetical protein